VWRDFVYLDTSAAKAMVAGAYKDGMSYTITFKDASLTNATIRPYAGGSLRQKVSGTLTFKAIGASMKIGLTEDTDAPPGDRWIRPSKFLGAVTVNTYELRRLFDGSHNVNKEENELMKSEEHSRTSNVRIFWDKSWIEANKRTCRLANPTRKTRMIEHDKHFNL
jgi:hypothetical protein